MVIWAVPTFPLIPQESDDLASIRQPMSSLLLDGDGSEYQTLGMTLMFIPPGQRCMVGGAFMYSNLTCDGESQMWRHWQKWLSTNTWTQTGNDWIL